MLDVTEYSKIFLSLFAILDPIGMIPIIIAFTLGITPQKRARIGRTASLAVTAILLIALLVGEWVLEFFGISMHSFRVAGGILLLLMSIDMLFGNRDTPSPKDSVEGESSSSLAIVPLSTPLLAGPGAISTIILDAHKGYGIGHYAVLGMEIMLMGFIVWITFLIAPWISQRLGRIGSDVFSRLMGLVIASIAVEFIAGGLRGLFPALG
jgi:multiple antibiotic resistance protein